MKVQWQVKRPRNGSCWGTVTVRHRFNGRGLFIVAETTEQPYGKQSNPNRSGGSRVQNGGQEEAEFGMV